MMLCAAPAIGQAQSSEPADYQALISAGLSAYGDERYREARELFARAHAISASARTLRALGITDLALDDFTRANAELEAALTHPSAPLTREQRKEVTDLVAWMRSRLGAVSVRVTPADAAVTVDGRRVEGADLLLAPDEHELVVSAAGYAPQTRRFRVALGAPASLRVDLVRAAVPAPDALARSEPPRSPELPAATRPRPPHADDAANSAWMWVGGAGIVLVGAGATLLTLGLNDKARVEQATPGVPLSELEAAHDRVPWFTGGGIALGVVGFGGVTAAAIMLLSAESRPGALARSVHLAPHGASVRLRF